jgi:O-acetyl-ADP-ribose deacetylase (regulator of RNase III)
MKVNIGEREIRIVQGDITETDCQSLVNPANSDLILGGGVAGAIRKKGGSSIQDACNDIGHCPVGEAVSTPAGDLKTNYVIHAVGPRMGEGDEDAKLRNATINSLKVAEEKKAMSIAFPAISTGIFGFPIDRCANIMLEIVYQFLKSEAVELSRVDFVLFDQIALNVFIETAKKEKFV